MELLRRGTALGRSWGDAQKRGRGHFGYAWSLEGNTQEVLGRYFMEVCANHREELTWDLGLTGDKMDTNLL